MACLSALNDSAGSSRSEAECLAPPVLVTPVHPVPGQVDSNCCNHLAFPAVLFQGSRGHSCCFESTGIFFS